MNIAVVALIVAGISLGVSVFLLFTIRYLLKKIHDILNKDYRLRKP